jgi:hypothetical protein
MSKKTKFNTEPKTHLVIPPRMEGKPKNARIRNIKKKKKG